MSDVYARLPDNLHAAIKKTAAQNHRSMNGEIAHAIEYYLKHAPEAHYEAVGQPAEKDEAKPE